MVVETEEGEREKKIALVLFCLERERVRGRLKEGRGALCSVNGGEF